MRLGDESHHEIRVIELRNGAGLAVEALAELRIGRERLRQNHDGDNPTEAGVGGSIDFAHAPRAGGREDLVGTETGACLQLQ
jgi:hypothetical protein